MDAHKNFAVSTVATAPSPATSGTSLVVASGHGTRFPATPFNATIWADGELPDPTNAEIVRVTNISTDTLTIVRAQESSNARTVIVGDMIAATITAKTLTDVEDAIASISGDVSLAAAGMYPSITAGCATHQKVEMTTNKQNVYVLDFADAATSYCEALWASPADWDAGTIQVIFYWMVASTATGTVRWQVEARAYADDDALDQSWGTAVAVDDDASGTANDVMISSATSAITVGGGPAAGELVTLRFARLGGHANDDLTGSAAARLLAVRLIFGRV